MCLCKFCLKVLDDEDDDDDDDDETEDDDEEDDDEDYLDRFFDDILAGGLSA
jgi:hypothetical protein